MLNLLISHLAISSHTPLSTLLLSKIRHLPRSLPHLNLAKPLIQYKHHYMQEEEKCRGTHSYDLNGDVKAQILLHL